MTFVDIVFRLLWSCFAVSAITCVVITSIGLIGPNFIRPDLEKQCWYYAKWSAMLCVLIFAFIFTVGCLRGIWG